MGNLTLWTEECGCVSAPTGSSVIFSVRPLGNFQARRLHRNDKSDPIAFVCGASVSDEVDERLIAEQQPSDWRSGLHPWMIDAVRFRSLSWLISVRVLAVPLYFFVSLQAAQAQSQAENRAKCTDPNPDIRIAGCTADIASGLERVPRDLAVAYANRGKAYFLKGENDEACADESKAISLNPAYASAYVDHGASCFYSKQEYDEAIKDFSKAIVLRPDLSIAYRNRCNVFYDKGLLDQAVADCDKAVSLMPSDAIAYLSRGKVYGTKGLYEKGVADMTKAIALDSHLQEAYYARGVAYRLMGLPEKAIPDFDKAISLNPHSAEALYARAASLEKLGRRDEAIADYRATFKLVPGNRKALEGLSRLGASPE